MGKKEKVFTRLKNSPASGTFEDVHNLLLWCGFELRRTTGSHYIYKRPGHAPIVSIPRHNPLKKCYVEEVVILFEKYFDFDDE
jgi:predicted RNA binding protein YcfA (HicA-like mRNA interferase family)